MLTLDEKLKLAKSFAASGFTPSGVKTPDQVLFIIEMGEELGLKPVASLNNINVIQGNPTLGADAMLGLAYKTGQVESVDMNDITSERAVIKIKRKGQPEVVRQYTIGDARQAGLAGRGVWKTFPDRMLKARALAFAVRDAFPDVLAGIYTPDEMEGVHYAADAKEAPLADSAPTSSRGNVGSAHERVSPASSCEEDTAPPWEPPSPPDPFLALHKDVWGRIKAFGPKARVIIHAVDPEQTGVKDALNLWREAGESDKLREARRYLDECGNGEIDVDKLFHDLVKLHVMGGLGKDHFTKEDLPPLLKGAHHECIDALLLLGLVEGKDDGFAFIESKQYKLAPQTETVDEDVPF